MVRRREGVFIFSGWLRRGDTTVPHAVGFNAGAGLLHVGPYVVVVQESDRIHLDVFAARMDALLAVHDVAVPSDVRKFMLDGGAALEARASSMISCTKPARAWC